jgi:DNA-nicking Smr family endonuclease
MAIKVNTSLKEIRKEVRHLVDLHSLDCEQAIYGLSQFFSSGEWNLVECELETHGYSLMNNSINDLFG